MDDTAIMERDIAGASLRLTECQLALEEINAYAGDPETVRSKVLVAMEAGAEARKHLIDLYRTYMRASHGNGVARPILMIRAPLDEPART